MGRWKRWERARREGAKRRSCNSVITAVNGFNLRLVRENLVYLITWMSRFAPAHSIVNAKEYVARVTRAARLVAHLAMFQVNYTEHKSKNVILNMFNILTTRTYVLHI